MAMPDQRFFTSPRPDVLTRLPGILAKDAKILTPANWLKARSGKEVRKAA